VLKIACCQHK